MPRSCSGAFCAPGWRSPRRRRGGRAGRQHLRLHRFGEGRIDRGDSRGAPAARAGEKAGPEIDRERLHVAAFSARAARVAAGSRCFHRARQVRELGAIVRARARRSAAGLTGRDSAQLRHRRPTYIPELRHAALPAHAGAQRLPENRRGLQSSVQLLRHPANARPASQPPAGIGARGDSRAGRRRREGDQPDQPGHDLLRHGSVDARKPGRASRSIPRAGRRSTALLREIEKIEGDFWVRLLYTHPAHWSDELIETIARMRQGRALHRHAAAAIDEAMLGRMRRETSRAAHRRSDRRIRAGIPGIALRTTFIVGFPGETEAEFESLLEFIEAHPLRAARHFQILAGGRLARREDAGQISGHDKKRALPPGHDGAATNRARNRGGKRSDRELKLLVDQPLIARTEADAPDVDTRVILPKPAPVGEFVRRKIRGREVTICWPARLMIDTSSSV